MKVASLNVGLLILCVLGHASPTVADLTLVRSGYQYTFVTSLATFNQSEQSCRNFGGHLASIHSADEDRAIRTQLNAIRSTNGSSLTSNFWIGLYFDGTNNGIPSRPQWNWTDGSPMDYISGWRGDKPNGNGQCARYFDGGHADTNYTWGSAPFIGRPVGSECFTTQYYYICKANQVTPPTATAGSTSTTPASTPTSATSARTTSSTTSPPVITVTPTVPSGRLKSPVGHFRYAAVAADGEPCSTIGTNIMAIKRGSAVDAAIATMICVGVVNSQSTGVGGGHFMNIYDTHRNGSSKEFMTILSRERAPLAATQDMYVVNTNPTASTIGGLAIGVPGEIKGYYEAWKRYGRVSWADLFTDSIALCRNGFPVNFAMADAIQTMADYLIADPNWRDLLYKQDGSLVTDGDIIYNLKLARTLEQIAADPQGFYNPSSKLAQDILADIKDYGGIITAADLTNYVPYIKPPVKLWLNNGGYYVYSPRPPSSGIVYQLILSILDGYNFTASSAATPSSLGLTDHRIVEAFKFAYAKRSALGDEEFINVQDLLTNLTSKDYANSLRLMIDDNTTHVVSYYQPSFQYEGDHGTSHVSVLGPDGSAVSLTSTINTFFGSTARGKRTGIVFNNEMDDFSTPNTVNSWGVPASPTNYIVPGKMPMSSMSPTIITDQDGRVVFIIGAEGGTRIITSTVMITMKTLWLGQSVGDAVDGPRIHHQLLPNYVNYEAGFNSAILDELRRRNHTTVLDTITSTVQSIHNQCDISGIFQRTACISAVSDRRKAGVPDGF